MADLEEEMENLNKLMRKIKSIYTDKTKLKGIELEEILKHDIWWDSKKCLEVGLVDKIVDKTKLYDIKKDSLEL
jgi:ATP-dependent protease ClpP protease subunit